MKEDMLNVLFSFKSLVKASVISPIFRVRKLGSRDFPLLSQSHTANE